MELESWYLTPKLVPFFTDLVGAMFWKTVGRKEKFGGGFFFFSDLVAEFCWPNWEMKSKVHTSLFSCLTKEKAPGCSPKKSIPNFGERLDSLTNLTSKYKSWNTLINYCKANDGYRPIYGEELFIRRNGLQAVLTKNHFLKKTPFNGTRLFPRCFGAD